MLVQFIKVSITYYNRYKAISQRTNFSQFAILDLFIVYGSHLGYHTSLQFVDSHCKIHCKINDLKYNYKFYCQKIMDKV